MPLEVISRVSLRFRVIFGRNRKKKQREKFGKKRAPSLQRRAPSPQRIAMPQRGLPHHGEVEGPKRPPLGYAMA